MQFFILKDMLNTRIFLLRNHWKYLSLCDFCTESFLFGFLNLYIAERITLKGVLTFFIKHLLLTLFLAHRGLLMGRIKKKQTIIRWKKVMYNFQKPLIFKRSLNTVHPSSYTLKTCYNFENFADIPTVFNMPVFYFNNLKIY